MEESVLPNYTTQEGGRDPEFSTLATQSHSTVKMFFNQKNVNLPSDEESPLTSSLSLSFVFLDPSSLLFRCARLVHTSQANLLLPSNNSETQNWLKHDKTEHSPGEGRYAG